MSICVTLLPSWDGQMLAYLYKVDSINHSAGHKRRHKHGRKRNTNPSQMGTLRHVYPHVLLFYVSCVYDMMTLWHLHSRRLWRPGSRQTGQWLFSRRYPGEKNEKKNHNYWNENIRTHLADEIARYTCMSHHCLASYLQTLQSNSLWKAWTISYLTSIYSDMLLNIVLIFCSACTSLHQVHKCHFTACIFRSLRSNNYWDNYTTTDQQAVRERENHKWLF